MPRRFTPAPLLLTLPLFAAPNVPLQPLAEQVRQIEAALDWLGQPLSPREAHDINEAVGRSDEAQAVAALEAVLDAHVLTLVTINPESVVKVERGAAPAELV